MKSIKKLFIIEICLVLVLFTLEILNFSFFRAYNFLLLALLGVFNIYQGYRYDFNREAKTLVDWSLMLFLFLGVLSRFIV